MCRSRQQTASSRARPHPWRIHCPALAALHPAKPAHQEGVGEAGKAVPKPSLVPVLVQLSCTAGMAGAQDRCVGPCRRVERQRGKSASCRALLLLLLPPPMLGTGSVTAGGISCCPAFLLQSYYLLKQVHAACDCLHRSCEALRASCRYRAMAALWRATPCTGRPRSPIKRTLCIDIPLCR